MGRSFDEVCSLQIRVGRHLSATSDQFRMPTLPQNHKKESSERDMKTKPFNLQAALNGAQVVTRDGRSVSQLVELKGVNGEHCVVAVVVGAILTFTRDGAYYTKPVDSPHDLLMVVKEKTVYANLYSSSNIQVERGKLGRFVTYSTEGEADKAAGPHRIGGRAIPITVEE